MWHVCAPITQLLLFFVLCAYILCLYGRTYFDDSWVGT